MRSLFLEDWKRHKRVKIIMGKCEGIILSPGTRKIFPPCCIDGESEFRKTPQDIWDYCEIRQKGISEIKNNRYAIGKIVAYREIQFFINGKCTDLGDELNRY